MAKKHKRALATGGPAPISDHSDTAAQGAVSHVRHPPMPVSDQPIIPPPVEEKVATASKNRWIQPFVRWRILTPTTANDEQNPIPTEQPRRRLHFRRILESLNTVIGSIVGMLILGLIVNTWIEARTPVTEILTIVVPQDWEERGDTPEAIVQEVRKRAADAIKGAGRHSEFIGNTELHNFEVDLSGNQISTRSLTHLWRDKVYHNRRILESGLVADKDEGWHLSPTARAIGEQQRKRLAEMPTASKFSTC